MSDIRDNDLILFHYRDGLPPERLREIELALAASPALDARYRALRRLLVEVDRDAVPQPDARFETRLWKRLQSRLDAPAATVATVPTPGAGTRSARPRRRGRLLWGSGLAAAAIVVVALFAPTTRDGTSVAPQSPRIATRAQAPTQTPAGDRALTAYVAAHLRSTEGLLQSVINNDGITLMPAGDDYVRSLADDNRLYAAAAARQGDKALAGFLESLDPVLIELANQPRGDEFRQVQGLRDFVRGSDLLFQVRAVEARLQSRGNRRTSSEGATS